MSENRSQSHDEFAERLSSVQTQLYSYIYSLICNINDADDLYQQTSIVLWRKFEQFDRSREFSSWAFGIARFEVSNFLKKRSRQRLYFSDELTLQLLETQQRRIENGASAPAVTTEERREILASCVQKLRISDQRLMSDCYDNATEHLDLKLVAEKIQTIGHKYLQFTSADPKKFVRLRSKRKRSSVKIRLWAKGNFNVRGHHMTQHIMNSMNPRSNSDQCPKGSKNEDANSSRLF